MPFIYDRFALQFSIQNQLRMLKKLNYKRTKLEINKDKTQPRTILSSELKL